MAGIMSRSKAGITLLRGNHESRQITQVAELNDWVIGWILWTGTIREVGTLLYSTGSTSYIIQIMWVKQ